MNQANRKTAMVGPRRFQWNVGGWFGGVVGGSAWLIPTTAILAWNNQSRLALLPAGCWLLVNLIGCVLWYRRDRVRPFPALVGVLCLLAVLTPLVWFVISSNATPASLSSLNWPQRGMGAAMVALIFPALIAWLCFLEYSHEQTPGSSHQLSRNVGKPSDSSDSPS